jgi:hypothetical protein
MQLSTLTWNSMGTMPPTFTTSYTNVRYSYSFFCANGVYR